MKKQSTGRIHNQELNETLDGQPGRLSHWVDEAIRQAERRGDFADLPGKGKPLNLTDRDPYAGDEAESYRVLKEAGFAPEWMGLRKEIIDGINWLRANPDHADRLVRITDLNAKIGVLNRKVPNASLALPKIPVDFGH